LKTPPPLVHPDHISHPARRTVLKQAATQGALALGGSTMLHLAGAHAQSASDDLGPYK
jgi:hypothetical protein